MIVTTYPTGSVGLDNALCGGWHSGTLNEIWGDPGAAKTVLALRAVESATRAGKETLWVDTVSGVAHMTNVPSVVVLPMREAERAFQVMEMACHEPDIGLIVVDSANFLARRAELRGDPDFVPHPQREYRVELTSLKSVARATGTVVLFVSQPRDKEREPIRGTGISEKVLWRVHLHADTVHQNQVREIVATVKHVPDKHVIQNAARFTVRPGKGIWRELELVEVGIELGKVVRAGSWVAYNNVQVQGTVTMAKVLEEQPWMADDLYSELRLAQVPA